ncbi:hypothetical protein [Pantoea agglomerans]|uniref:hypothetical protein n=1 Tax=Enterobacter agglomerans TaxID=549 RepID=UPI001E40FD30|nr:hypothetical protein [Pantoea agglomerans]
MTATTEVKQPNFLMMKRVWIAIALPIVIFYFSGIQGLVQLAIVWIFASIMLLMFAYKKIPHQKVERQHQRPFWRARRYVES